MLITSSIISWKELVLRLPLAITLFWTNDFYSQYNPATSSWIRGHRFGTGTAPSSRVAPIAAPLLPLRFVFGGLTNRRRFASIRSGRHLRRSHPFLSSHWTVTLIVTRRYLKDKFTASFLDSCFDFPDSSFCLVLRRSLSSSSSQLNNTHFHCSAHTRTSWG